MYTCMKETECNVYKCYQVQNLENETNMNFLKFIQLISETFISWKSVYYFMENLCPALYYFLLLLSLYWNLLTFIIFINYISLSGVLIFTLREILYTHCWMNGWMFHVLWLFQHHRSYQARLPMKRNERNGWRPLWT